MSNGEKFKILVVDDQISNIEALTSILKPTYSVLVAKDGQTGLDVARDNKPDLILLDVIMPGLSGFDVLLELKNSDQTRNIPVIFITGRDSAEDERKGLNLGAVDYITKPFHNFIVQARVRTHLQNVEYIRTIERLCRIDVLTNIPNRRFFDTQINMEWERAIRDKKSISILMIDIDRFKDYNDTYGHPQGDVLLKTVAVIFTQALNRPADFAARWGGEEFTVLLPDTDLEGAMEVAERIRADVEAAVIPYGEVNTGVTVSIGVNVAQPVSGSSLEEFISLSDKALYAAKNSGRNNVKSFV